MISRTSGGDQQAKISCGWLRNPHKLDALSDANPMIVVVPSDLMVTGAGWSIGTVWLERLHRQALHVLRETTKSGLQSVVAQTAAMRACSQAGLRNGKRPLSQHMKTANEAKLGMVLCSLSHL